jgi:hypothetical protein
MKAAMSEVEFYCEVFSFVSSRITEKLHRLRRKSVEGE